MTSPSVGDRPDRPSEARHSWIKSSLSFSNSNCVEVASLPDGRIGVRDSKDPSGPVLRFTPGEWQAFVGGAHNGESDHFGSLQAHRGNTWAPNDSSARKVWRR